MGCRTAQHGCAKDYHHVLFRVPDELDSRRQRPGENHSTLSTIGAGTGLEGTPIARKVSFSEAASFFRCVVGKEVSEVFPKEQLDLDIYQTEENAVRVVLATLDYIRLKF